MNAELVDQKRIYQRRRYGCLGAILIHVALFAFAYVWGFVVGAPYCPLFETLQYNHTGGLLAAVYLLIVYIISYGVVPLFMSIVGWAIGIIYWDKKQYAVSNVDNASSDRE